MPNAVRLRAELESTLSARVPGAFSARLRQEPERVACGIAELDEWLCGGLPVGALTELVGAECSGRTSAALAYVASTMKAGSVCAWIDVADTLDPETAAANGVDLERLLWVRCGGEREKPRSAPSENMHEGPAVSSSVAARPVGGGSQHPRSEGRGMPDAIQRMMRAETLPEVQARRERKVIGTPGAPNRPLSYRSEQRVEQPNSDRLPARRGDNLALFPRGMEPMSRRSEGVAVVDGAAPRAARGNLWQALDQALRVTDLLLQAGGFGLLILDMGSVPPEKATRVPAATWFRFRAACERSRSGLLLLSQHACTQSSAELVVRMEPGSVEKESAVMTGMLYSALTERSRHAARVVAIRKPPQPHREQEKSGRWKSDAAWARGL